MKCINCGDNFKLLDKMDTCLKCTLLKLRTYKEYLFIVDHVAYLSFNRGRTFRKLQAPFTHTFIREERILQKIGGIPELIETNLMFLCDIPTKYFIEYPDKYEFISPEALETLVLLEVLTDQDVLDMREDIPF